MVQIYAVVTNGPGLPSLKVAHPCSRCKRGYLSIRDLTSLQTVYIVNNLKATQMPMHLIESRWKH